MTEPNLTVRLKEYLAGVQGREVTIRGLRAELDILQGNPAWDGIRVLMHNLAKKGIVKPSGQRDGVYKVLTPVEAVRWWDGDEGEPLDFRFPKEYDADSGFEVAVSEFGIEDCVEVFAGDFIMIAGTSNYGKTAIALSLLGENLGLFPESRLMGSEYTASDGKISPKFKRRMGRMKWVQWIQDGKPMFELLPVGADYEDYIKSDALNLVDWISLPGEYFLIDTVTKKMKDMVGNGVLIGVLQKNRASEWAEGGERAERYADVCLYIDPFGDESMLRLGKVKSPKGRATGRMWGFRIVDHGANLRNIREIVKCPNCWGKGYTGSQNNYRKCDVCEGRKYIDK